MRRPALIFLASVSLGMPLSGCATPEELAARSAMLGRDTQTGTRIQQSSSGTRADSVSDDKAIDDTIKDLRNLPAQTASPTGGGR